MFECGRLFHHSVPVQTSFVSKSGFSDVRRAVGQTDVYCFGNAPRGIGKFCDALRRQDFISFFELQIKYRGYKVAVTASFAEPEKSALNMHHIMLVEKPKKGILEIIWLEYLKRHLAPH